MIKAGIQRLLNSMGFDVIRFATNFSPHELQTIQKVKGLTATGPCRIVGLMDAVKYVVANQIEGGFIECGVWRGGSSMVAAYTLLEVEDTIPQHAPERIALLRLDTDWYESTKHELEHLYPRLAPHGVLIIDDYGHWVGAKQAVDEYFATQKLKPFLNRLDYTGRLVIKPAG